MLAHPSAPIRMEWFAKPHAGHRTGSEAESLKLKAQVFKI